jgi:hypothetical protein
MCIIFACDTVKISEHLHSPSKHGRISELCMSPQSAVPVVPLLELAVVKRIHFRISSSCCFSCCCFLLVVVWMGCLLSLFLFRCMTVERSFLFLLLAFRNQGGRAHEIMCNGVFLFLFVCLRRDRVDDDLFCLLGPRREVKRKFIFTFFFPHVCDFVCLF